MRALAAALALALPAIAEARELGGGFRVQSALEAAVLGTRAPDAPLFYPERNGDATAWRLRVAPEATPASWITIGYAHEVRLRSASGSGGAAGSLLLPRASLPWRVEPLDWLVHDTATSESRHGVDRAFVALHLPAAEITLGRQAIGWGRGVLFSAVDVLAPFSPFEVTREWRPGVDAARAEVRFGDRLSADAVGAFGETFDESVVALRVRGYAGEADAEVVAGRRATDLFAGATGSAAIGDAEAHGELAFFDAEEPLPAGGALGRETLAWKSVLGASYRFDVHRGIAVFGEWHHSTFGARRAGDLGTLILDPAFQERLLRGDMQILGRDALALTASAELADLLSASLVWVHAPAGGSGNAGLALTWSATDAVTVIGGGYVPYGRPPRGVELRSEYGASPITGYLLVRVYD